MRLACAYLLFGFGFGHPRSRVFKMGLDKLPLLLIRLLQAVKLSLQALLRLCSSFKHALLHLSVGLQSLCNERELANVSMQPTEQGIKSQAADIHPQLARSCRVSAALHSERMGAKASRRRTCLTAACRVISSVDVGFACSLIGCTCS